MRLLLALLQSPMRIENYCTPSNQSALWIQFRPWFKYTVYCSSTMLSQHSYSVGIQTHLKERDWLTLITFNVRIKRRKKQTLQSQETRRWSAGGIGEIIFFKTPIIFNLSTLFCLFSIYWWAFWEILKGFSWILRVDFLILSCLSCYINTKEQCVGWNSHWSNV